MRQGREKEITPKQIVNCSKKPLYSTESLGQMEFSLTGDFLRNASRIIPLSSIACYIIIVSGSVNSTAHPGHSHCGLYT